MEKYIEDYSYENCFWDNVEFLYEHSRLKYKEYLSIGDLSYNLANSINKFCKSLLSAKEIYHPYNENDISSRGKGIQKVLNFINKIIQNLEVFANNLSDIKMKIDEKKYSYESKKSIKKMCDDNFKQYENSLKLVNSKKNAYYDSINQAIEQHLTNLYKKDLKNLIEIKIDNIKKKEKEYKEQLLKTENYRIDYIELQRNIFSSEEEFERDSTNEIKQFLKEILSFYEDFLKNSKIDEEIYDILEKIDGVKDNQIFAENNRTIMTCPSRIQFCEYTQNIELYSNLEVIKNQLKLKTKDKVKEFQNEIASEVKKFLNTNIVEHSHNEIINKFQKITNDILNNSLTEEDFNYLINQFQNSYDDYQKWLKENVGSLDFKKVGEKYDNRFINMKIFLDAFNKVRMHNKELDHKNYEYFVKAMEKILSLNDNEDIDYKLCELLITLSSTFYTLKNKDEKKDKKYASDIIKNAPLIQKCGFWVGMTKYELNEELLREKNKENNSNKNVSIFNNFNFNFNIKINVLNKKKKEENNQQVINKNIIAKLMSISYNLIQFITDSDTLNKILEHIFRNFKINKENKEMIIGMMNAQIESEGIKHLKINEEMLLNCDKLEYLIKSEENKEKKDNIEKNEIKDDKKEEQLKDKNEIKDDKKNEQEEDINKINDSQKNYKLEDNNKNNNDIDNINNNNDLIKEINKENDNKENDNNQ